MTSRGSHPDRHIRDALYPGGALIGQDEEEAVMRVMRRRSLFRYYGITPPSEVAAYEREWAAHIGTAHALAVNSGTSALLCSLVAAGVGKGDEVILPAFAWASVPNAILQAGALPVVVDVDDTLTLDVDAARRQITDRTAAILPVHMRGSACAMDAILSLATEAGVPVIEDACQAAGVTFGGRRAGSFGRVAAFSTQYAKLVCTGEGGVVVTDDSGAHRAALDAHDPANALRRGEPPSSYPGLNLRATELQAAIGRVQLARLASTVERLRAHAARIEASVAAHPEFTVRRHHDRSGANGAAVIFFARSAAAAVSVRDGLRDAGVAQAVVLHEPPTPDLHVAACWPAVTAATRRSQRDAPDISTSLDLLARAVQIDVHPLYEDADVDAICAAVDGLPMERREP